MTHNSFLPFRWMSSSSLSSPEYWSKYQKLEVRGTSGPQLLVGGTSVRFDFVLRALRALRPRLTHQTCKKCDGRTNGQGVSRNRTFPYNHTVVIIFILVVYHTQMMLENKPWHRGSKHVVIKKKIGDSSITKLWLDPTVHGLENVKSPASLSSEDMFEYVWQRFNFLSTLFQGLPPISTRGGQVQSDSWARFVKNTAQHNNRPAKHKCSPIWKKTKHVHRMMLPSNTNRNKHWLTGFCDSVTLQVTLMRVQYTCNIHL